MPAARGSQAPPSALSPPSASGPANAAVDSHGGFAGAGPVGASAVAGAQPLPAPARPPPPRPSGSGYTSDVRAAEQVRWPRAGPPGWEGRNRPFIVGHRTLVTMFLKDDVYINHGPLSHGLLFVCCARQAALDAAIAASLASAAEDAARQVTALLAVQPHTAHLHG